MGWASNQFPLLIIDASGGFTGIFEYSPAPGAGNLIASDTVLAGTDPYGNAYLAGRWSYATSTGTAAGLVGGYLTFATGTATSWTLQGLIALHTTGIPGGKNTIAVFTEANTAGFEVDNGPIYLPSLASAPASGYAGVTFFGNGGSLNTVNGNDTATYDTERLSLPATATPQLFNSTSTVVITGCQDNHIGVGTYRVRGQIVYEGVAAAAGAVNVSFQGTGTVVSAMQVTMTQIQDGALTFGNVASLTALATNFTTGTLSITARQYVIFDGLITTTTGGNLKLQAACTVAADTFNVLFGTYLEVMPIVA